MEDLLDMASPGPQPESASRGNTRTSSRPTVAFENFDASGVPGSVSLSSPEFTQDPDQWLALVQSTGGPTIPAGYQLVLKSCKLQASGWVRDIEDRYKPHSAYSAPLWNYQFAVERVVGAAIVDEDLDALYATLRLVPPRGPIVTPYLDRAGVVLFADPQIGKVDYRGGSAELLERIGEKLDAIDAYWDHLAAAGKPVQHGVWLDGGDLREGFSNTVQQQQTNDLTETRQQRVGRRVVAAGIERMAARFSSVDVAVVGSNHCAVRKGKDVVADPLDDWGIDCYSAVMDGMAYNPRAFGHINWHFPQEWEKTLSFDVLGNILGLAHGEEANSANGIIDWWEGQMGGGKPLADVDILNTGHFHYPRLEQPWSGKWWSQGSTMDNGSGWYGNKKGRTSDPGVVVYTVTAEGLDTSTWAVL
jgi:hypothetical protein